MKKFDGTQLAFIESITHNNRGYLKKPRGRIVVALWWEEVRVSDYHFMNVTERKINVSEFPSSQWYMKRDVEWLIQTYVKEGYEMYFD